jgi:hypothetical protein
MEDREQGYRWEFKEANEYLDKNIRQEVLFEMVCS